MKKLCLLILALPLFANDELEADDIMSLGDWWFTFVSLTPTNLVLKSTERGRGVFIYGPDINEYMHKHNEKMKEKYSNFWHLKDDMEFTIPLDKELTFTDGRHVKIIYTPILLTNQHKGFQIADLGDNMYGGYDSIVWHVALNEPPIRVDESEVKMILVNGKWMDIGDTDSVEIKQLKWKAAWLIGDPTAYKNTLAYLSYGSSEPRPPGAMNEAFF